MSWKVLNLGCHLSRHVTVGRFSSGSDIRQPGCCGRTCGASQAHKVRRHQSNSRFRSRGHRNPGPYPRGGHYFFMWNRRTDEGCLRWPKRSSLFISENACDCTESQRHCSTWHFCYRGIRWLEDNTYENRSRLGGIGNDIGGERVNQNKRHWLRECIVVLFVADAVDYLKDRKISVFFTHRCN